MASSGVTSHEPAAAALLQLLLSLCTLLPTSLRLIGRRWWPPWSLLPFPRPRPYRVSSAWSTRYGVAGTCGRGTYSYYVLRKPSDVGWSAIHRLVLQGTRAAHREGVGAGARARVKDGQGREPRIRPRASSNWQRRPGGPTSSASAVYGLRLRPAEYAFRVGFPVTRKPPSGPLGEFLLHRPT